MKLHPFWSYSGDRLAMGRDFYDMGREERGGKWGMRGREVGIEGAGSGNRG